MKYFGEKNPRWEWEARSQSTLNSIAKDFELDAKSEGTRWNILTFISYLLFF